MGSPERSKEQKVVRSASSDTGRTNNACCDMQFLHRKKLFCAIIAIRDAKCQKHYKPIRYVSTNYCEVVRCSDSLSLLRSCDDREASGDGSPGV